MLEPYSSFPEARWPRVPSPYASGVLAMLFQLEQSQWLQAERLLEKQIAQLCLVVEHAQKTVPFYSARLGKEPLRLTSLSQWQHEIPLLSRRDIQLAGDSLHSADVPKSHGKTSRTTTGGSTGQPVQILGTDFTEFIWRVLTLRDHIWHKRDFDRSFAAIRYMPEAVGRPPLGTPLDTWGSSTRNVVPTGPACVLNITSSIEDQAQWLRHVNPGYALAYPSALREIASLFAKHQWQVPQLQQLLTYGEVLDTETRSLCEKVFGVPLVDMYSSQEVGYLALQCPISGDYHVQSENVLVEVLNEDGKPCQVGEIGRVVVSSLHNFAMPLLRYDIGDFAEVGGACTCHRGLPVLRKILGRQRNLLTMPDGTRRWPVFASVNDDDDLPPFFQFQVVQHNLQELEIKVVRPWEVTEAEQLIVQRHFQRILQHPFRVHVTRVDEIPRSHTGKFEDFISHVGL